jgi:hypothetical protein
MSRALAASRSFLNLCPDLDQSGGWHLIASARIGFGRNAGHTKGFKARIVRCRFAERFASSRSRSSANSRNRALRSAPIWMSISSHAFALGNHFKSKIIFKSKATIKIEKGTTEDRLHNLEIQLANSSMLKLPSRVKLQIVGDECATSRSGQLRP